MRYWGSWLRLYCLRGWFPSNISMASIQYQSKFKQAHFWKKKNRNWQTDSKIYMEIQKKIKKSKYGKGRMKSGNLHYLTLDFYKSTPAFLNQGLFLPSNRHLAISGDNFWLLLTSEGRRNAIVKQWVKLFRMLLNILKYKEYRK